MGRINESDDENENFIDKSFIASEGSLESDDSVLSFLETQDHINLYDSHKVNSP